MEQAAKQGCSVSVFEEFQDLAGLSCKQPGLPSTEILYLAS